jgi:hypothetical protein
MKTSRQLLGIVAVALLVVLGAPSEPAVAAGGHAAMLRVFHAAPDAPELDVIVEGLGRVATGVRYGHLSHRATIPAGYHTVRVVPAGASVAAAMTDVEVNVLYDRRYMLVLSELDGRHELLPLELPVGCPMTQQRTQIRVLQAAPLGMPIDLKVEEGPYLFRGLEYGKVSDCLLLPAGDYQLEVLESGFTWNVGAVDDRAELGAGNAYVLVIGPSRKAPDRLVRIWAIPMLGGGHGLGQPSR